MLQTQGSASDPFRTLQLLPHAPRDLIVRAHVLLRARAERTGDAVRLDSLRAALGEALAAADGCAGRLDDDAPGSHYHTLAVAEDADAELITVAYRVAIARVPADAPEGVRDAIEDARATLTNTYRRARYDADLHGASPFAPAAPVAPPPPSVVVASSSATAAPDPPLDTHQDGLPQQLPLAFDPPPAVAARRGVLRRRVRNRPKKLSAAVELRPHIAPLLPRLCDEGELIAELRFIEGPLAGATVPIADGRLTLGASPGHDVRLAGAATMRIWRLDGRYLLRRIEGEARIDGVAMALPAAQLEAGTVLDTGPHRAVFAFRRVPQALLPMLSASAGADNRAAR